MVVVFVFVVESTTRNLVVVAVGVVVVGRSMTYLVVDLDQLLSHMSLGSD
jgi:hypothetical protein